MADLNTNIELTPVADRLYVTVSNDACTGYGSSKEEFAKALRAIPAPNVLYSGGIDSELILEAAKDNNIPVDISIMKYIVDGIHLNYHDTNYAESYCKQHNLSYTLYDLNLSEFLESGKFVEYAIKYKCNSPQLCCHLWLLDNISGTPILGGNVVNFLHRDGEINFFYQQYKYYTYNWYFDINDRDGVSNMLTHTPGIVLSTLDAQIRLARKHIILEYIEPGQETYYRKCKLYEEMGFVAEPKADKFTGFEHIRIYYKDKYNEQCDYGAFNDRFRLPIERMVPQPRIIHNYSDEMNRLLDSYKEIFNERD